MYSTRTRVNARIPNGHPRQEKRASGQKSGRQVGELNGPRAPRQSACRCARRTRRLPREDPRTKVGEEVRVGVGVGPAEFSFKSTRTKFRAQVQMAFLYRTCGPRPPAAALSAVCAEMWKRCNGFVLSNGDS